jgi:sugar transferase (PEP-CTERM/EpsH1 system associated)
MARFAMEPPLSGIPAVIDLVDVDSAKWDALGQASTWPRRWIYEREAQRLARFERHAVTRARHTIVVNEREALILKQLAPKAVIDIIPNGVDIAALAPSTPAGPGADVVFCGVMDYSPNVDAVVWFAREVWPRIRLRRPTARFMIVGSSPISEVRRLAQEGSGIVVTGTVPDVREYLWNAAVSVAPLKTSRGVQNKVLEAIAAGLPAVITPQVLDGLPLEVRRACRIADSAEEFVTETLSLLDLTGDARRTLAQQADLAGLAWERQLAPLGDLLESAASGRPGPRS